MTRDEVIADTGAWLADALDASAVLTPRQVAERSAAVADGTATVDEIEDRVRAHRGMVPLDRPEAGAA